MLVTLSVMDVDDLVAHALEHGFTNPDLVREWARETVLMRPDPTMETGARGSRLGGMPALPPATPWPRSRDKHLGFVAQIDLSTLPAAAVREGFPATGLLSFFFDPDQRTWGDQLSDKDLFAVVYSEDAASAVLATKWPDDMPAHGRLVACALTSEVTLTLPPGDSFVVERRELPEAQLEAYFAVEEQLHEASPASSGRCLLGGHPDQIQNDMLIPCALAMAGSTTGYDDPRLPELSKTAHEWRLLLQVPSEDFAGMQWGDCGCLYYWIRESDLRARRFDRAWMIVQCY